MLTESGCSHVLLVEHVERSQTHVGDFFLIEGDCGIDRSIPHRCRRYICSGSTGCRGGAARQQGCANDTQHWRDFFPSPLLGSQFRIWHSRFSHAFTECWPAQALSACVDPSQGRPAVAASRMRGANPVRHVVNRTVAPTGQDDPFHSRQHKHHTYRSISHSFCGCARTVINHNCWGGGAISPSRRLRVCRRIIGDDNPLGLSSNTAGHPISTPGLLKLRSLGREMY